VKLLLDTHIVLWWLGMPERLRPEVHRTIADSDNLVFFSAVNSWEIAIKVSLGKLPVLDLEEMHRDLEKDYIRPLPVLPEHTQALVDLPWLHKDPFDRLLLAQAQHEELTLVTRDEAILAYPVSLLQG